MYELYVQDKERRVCLRTFPECKASTLDKLDIPNVTLPPGFRLVISKQLLRGDQIDYERFVNISEDGATICEKEGRQFFHVTEKDDEDVSFACDVMVISNEDLLFHALDSSSCVFRDYILYNVQPQAKEIENGFRLRATLPTTLLAMHNIMIELEGIRGVPKNALVTFYNAFNHPIDTLRSIGSDQTIHPTIACTSIPLYKTYGPKGVRVEIHDRNITRFYVTFNFRIHRCESPDGARK